MSNPKYYIWLLLLLCVYVNQNFAQCWTQNRRDIYTVGTGITQVVFLPAKYYPLNNQGSLGLSINMSGEYRVHKFIGIGWQTGVNVFIVGRYYNKPTKSYIQSTVTGVPIGGKVNIHILELSKNKHKDKLDMYAGVNFGAGPAFHSNPNGGIYPFIYGGPQFGIHYWFKRTALFAEVGWGATIVNFGFSF